MNRLLGFTSLLLTLVSCGNSNTLKEEELALRERELALKERELSLQQGDENIVKSGEKDFEVSQTPQVSTQQKIQRTTAKPKTEAQLREELYNTEKSNPKKYLTVDYDLTVTIFGEDKITGHIYNYATLASFKDVELKVTYLSGTDSEIDSETYIIYEYVPAGKSIPFNLKTFSPSGTKKIGVKINAAKSE